MKNYTISILLSLSCCAAWSQSDIGVSANVTESTDPARAAEVERKAQEIYNQEDKSSGSSGNEEQDRSGNKNKKLRGHYKAKSSSGASGDAGQSQSGEGGGLRSPTQKSPSDSSNTSGGSTRYSTPGAIGNPSSSAYDNEKRLREKETNAQPGMPR